MDITGNLDLRIVEMVRRIVEGFHPERVILFGSRARETTGADSDVDLLVIMHVTGSRRKQAAEIDLALADRTLPVDLIVLTPDDVEQFKNTVGHVVYPAMHEGKVLYERPA